MKIASNNGDTQVYTNFIRVACIHSDFGLGEIFAVENKLSDIVVSACQIFYIITGILPTKREVVTMNI